LSWRSWPQAQPRPAAEPVIAGMDIITMDIINKLLIVISLQLSVITILLAFVLRRLR
jgi:hypothetical protein